MKIGKSKKSGEVDEDSRGIIARYFRVTDMLNIRTNVETRFTGIPVRILGGAEWLPVLVLLLFMLGCAGRPLPSTPSGRPDPSRPPLPAASSDAFRPGQLPIIRIGLLVHRDSASLAGSADLKVVDKSSGEVIGTSSTGQTWKMQAKGAWIDVSAPGGGAQGLYTGPIEVSARARDGRIKVADREYRGTMEVVSTKNGKLTVVNILDVENYLRGVVPPEIGKLKEDGIEALKTQAIAARTYTVANLGRRKALGFDLYGTVADQVYHGYGAEWTIADRAIAETRGVIATYKGQPIAAYYSSTCAGETESIEDAWGGRSVSYLRSVRDRAGRGADFCRHSPVYTWRVEWKKKTLENILATRLPGLDPRKAGEFSLRGLDVKKRSPTGRVQLLEIKSNHGTTTLRGDRIRSALRRPVRGQPMLRSTKFSLKFRQDSIVAEGGGYGHGIGLCQMGAIGMARQGYKHDRILKHYYRGIDLDRVY